MVHKSTSATEINAQNSSYKGHKVTGRQADVLYFINRIFCFTFKLRDRDLYLSVCVCMCMWVSLLRIYKVPVHNFKCLCQYVCLCMFMCICALIISCHTNFEFDLLRSRSKHTNTTLSFQISTHFSIALARQHIKRTVIIYKF